MSKLVIVESPAKAKNIKGYLGKGYDVVASMGHVRDLPAARLSVDIAHDFAPKYAVIAGKENFVKDLKKKAQAADYVYLATDPDREGEAISWHLATLLGLDMKEKNLQSETNCQSDLYRRTGLIQYRGEKSGTVLLYSRCGHQYELSGRHDLQ